MIKCYAAHLIAGNTEMLIAVTVAGFAKGVADHGERDLGAPLR